MPVGAEQRTDSGSKDSYRDSRDSGASNSSCGSPKGELTPSQPRNRERSKVRAHGPESFERARKGAMMRGYRLIMESQIVNETPPEFVSPKAGKRSCFSAFLGGAKTAPRSREEELAAHLAEHAKALEDFRQMIAVSF